MSWNESLPDVVEWGDISFGTADFTETKDQESAKLTDNVPVPVIIAELLQKGTSDEKYVLGEYAFSTAMVMGIVKSVEEDNLSLVYKLCDPDDETKESVIKTYCGVDCSAPAVPLVVNTRAIAIGKVRSFDGQFGIMAYYVNEIKDDREYYAFVREAKVAKLYFSKGVARRLQSGLDSVTLTGCSAGAPAPEPPTQSLSQAYEEAYPVRPRQRPPRVYDNSSVNATMPLGGHTRIFGVTIEILHYMRELCNTDNISKEGVSVYDIKQKFAFMHIDDFRFQLDILIAEGYVYSTTDQDHFALVP